MPVPIITGVSQISRQVESERRIEENGTANESVESDEKVKNVKEESVEKGQDCLEQGTVSDLIDIESDYDDVTEVMSATAIVETPAIPLVKIEEVNDSNSKVLVEKSNELVKEGPTNGSNVVTALRAVETVPCTSYSSSDDDDDDDDEDAEFFDANEYTVEIETHLEKPKRLVKITDFLLNHLISQSFLH